MRQTADNRVRYAAFKAKDARFDGRFFVGVSSTGIYCTPFARPNCRRKRTARSTTPLRPQSRPGIGHASCAGPSWPPARRRWTRRPPSPSRRPDCWRRVEGAGGTSRSTSTGSGARTGISAGLSQPSSKSRRRGISRRADCCLPRICSRTRICRRCDADAGLPPPYRWERVLDFLAQRTIPSVETVSDGSYMRTAHYATGDERRVYGWLRVGHRPRKNALAVSVSPPLLPALPHLPAHVRNLFDLNCHPDAVYETLSAMNDFRHGLYVPGTRLPGCFEPFEMAVLGQQIGVKAAGTLAGRIAEAFGAPVETGVAGLTRAFPSARDILALGGEIADRLGPLGVTRVRANSILGLAKKIAGGEIDFALCTRPETEIGKLLSTPGVGDWTAQYIAMRAMSWPDAFPHTDHGVRKALAPLSGSGILETAEAWRPWRAYATISLWNSL